MRFGTAWYPEHWPEDRWPEDLRLMREAGMNVVRVGEFAWSRMEPADGRFELDWLARAIEQAAAHGMSAVMCTPTAAPPSWLTRACPEILPVRNARTGERQLHGARGHYDPSNPDYRRFCARICDALGRRFGTHPAVIGWQLDNEFWSIACNAGALAAFREWLRAEYGSLEELNRLWSSSYWSQEYFAWEDIQPPTSQDHPGLTLAWHRFHSALYADFARIQIRALRAHCAPRQWITHNFHPFDEFDRAAISEPLDIVAWDAYIVGERLPLDPAANGCDCDRLRGIKRRNIWIMETLPGFVNWRPVNRHAEPGETRAMAWHMVGHGADAVLYWQWRSAPNNQEQYHGCLIQQDGRPRPIYAEIAATGAEFARLAPLLADTAPRADIAFIDRWADRLALRRQRQHKDYDPRERLLDFYRPVQALGHATDVLERVADPLPYRLIVAPHLHLLSDADAAILRRYVEAGGHLLLGPRSGMKDEHSRLRPQRQPGPLAGLLGADVEEFYALPEPIEVTWDQDSSWGGAIRIFAERLEVHDETVGVLAAFGEGNGWLRGRPAIVTAARGRGRITLCAGSPDEHLSARLAQWACAAADCTPLLVLPEDVEATARYRPDGGRVLIVVNHGRQERRVRLDGPMREHIGGGNVQGELVLPASAVAVLTDA